MEKMRNYFVVLLSGLIIMSLAVSCGQKSMLIPVSNITIPACSGEASISEANELFSWADDRFINWKINQPSLATVETAVQVYELNEDATFRQMFNPLNSDIDQLCLTQAQITSFCENFRSSLSPKNATSFLVKENNKHFVVSVYIFTDSLHVYVDRLYLDDFHDGFVWNGGDGHRIVVPQHAD